VVWGMLFVANNLVLGKPLPKLTLPLVITGIVLVLIFSNFQKNIFKGMQGIVFNLPFSVIGSFSDIVSYIRLFAVGFATVIVATNFNNIIIRSGVNSIFKGIFVAILLFMAHALNIVLCLMSVLVHGIRLNMLEFSGHIGVQWTGKPYQPFKE
jgi:V/A-type H+-transporting ATPase subunit I